MKERKNPKKPYIYFYVITLIVVMLLNAFIFPVMLKQKIIQVDYGTFLTQIEKGKVKVVEIQEHQIEFTEVNEAGEETRYETGRIDDPKLVNRIYYANVKFSKVIPRENSPNEFFVVLVFSNHSFYGIGQLLTLQQKRMGALMP